MIGWWNIPQQAPKILSGKQFFLGRQKWRGPAAKYHLAESEKETSSLCGIEIHDVRKPDGDGTVSDLAAKYPICSLCSQSASGKLNGRVMK